MNPGVTVMPSASITSVFGPARLRTSSVLPTATNRPARTANASARGSASSTVYTRALTTARSGGPSPVAGSCAAATGSFATPTPPASTALRPRNSLRV